MYVQEYPERPGLSAPGKSGQVVLIPDGYRDDLILCCWALFVQVDETLTYLLFL